MEDDKLIPLSYISQYDYCRRRVGLLLLEQQWDDSVDTVKGTAEHKNVHKSGHITRREVSVITEMEVYSKKYNIIGKCDAVEAYENEDGVFLSFLGNKRYRLYPVEYKHGKLRSEEEYELQLCAQAMCIEEMYSCNIETGAIFYISSHRRKEVVFTEKMRQKVESIAKCLTSMLDSYEIPLSEFSSKCIKCSLKDICMPETDKSVDQYMRIVKRDLRKED